MILRRQLGGGLAATALLAVGLVGAGAAPASAFGDVESTSGGCPPVDDPLIEGKAPAVVNTGIPQSWPLATGKGVTVAVVDSGVDPSNVHLGPDVVLPGTSFVSVNATPDGRGAPVPHGTAVAGIIAARPLDGSGLTGVAHDAKILPVQVFSVEDQDDQPDPGEPDTTLMAAGIRWAVDNGADVINVSMSTDSQDTQLATLDAALDYAYEKDVVVVASAGNQDDDVTAEEAEVLQSRWPAAHEKVIGVAATNRSGVVDDYTVHGPGADVSAPGQDILVTSVGNRGDCVAGSNRPYSSWAAPFVAGLAAQLRERYPKASVDEITYRILASADRPRLGYRDDVQGWGQIRPVEALTMTIDETIPGPPLPKGLKRERPEAVTDVEALGSPTDPWADARESALWWGIGGAGLTALALILRPAARRRLSTSR